MSLITFSGIGITDARGKVGNRVISRNRGGSVIREWVIPTNTITPRRTQIWDAMTTISQLWRVNDDYGRRLWEIDSRNYPRKSKLSKVFYLSGYNHFISANFGLALADMPLSLDPPPPHTPVNLESFSVVSLTPISLDLNATTFNSDLVIPPNNVCITSATIGVSAGIMYKKTGFRIFKRGDPGGIFFGSAYADYVTEFGAPVLDTKIFLKFYSVSQISGRISEPLRTTAIVQP